MSKGISNEISEMIEAHRDVQANWICFVVLLKDEQVRHLSSLLKTHLVFVCVQVAKGHIFVDQEGSNLFVFFVEFLE